MTFVQFRSATFIDDESQSATVVITRTGDTVGGSTVVVNTIPGGTATPGASCTGSADFISVVNRTVTFGPGETSRTILITLCGDLLEEPTETIFLRLTSPSSGAGVGGQGTATVLINDTANQFRNPTPIEIFNGTAANPYPCAINVMGATVNPFRIRVTLYDLSHNFPDNIDVLLVSPTGVKFILMGDAGGPFAISPNNPVTLTFQDSAGRVLPDSTMLMTGKYEPTNWETPVSSFPAPAPPAPYVEPGSAVGGPANTTLFGNFAGINPNGVWSIYVRDDAGNTVPFAPPSAVLVQNGVIAGGCGIEFLAATAAGSEVSGRVTTEDGRGLRNAEVSMVDTRGVTRTAITGTLGYYRFDDVDTGETYIIGVSSKRYRFSSRVLQVFDSMNDVDFIGLE